MAINPNVEAAPGRAAIDEKYSADNSNSSKKAPFVEGTSSQIISSRLPEALQEYATEKMWVCSEVSTEKKRLVNPHDVNKNASTSDRSTWGTFEEANNAVDTHQRDRFAACRPQYVAIVITPPLNLVCIDLDHVRNRDTGEINPEALKIVESLNSYTEISASGTGLHVFIRAKKKISKTKKTLSPETGANIEVFDLKFVTVTNQIWGEKKPLREAQEDLDAICQEYFKEDEEDDVQDSIERSCEMSPKMEDEEIIERASKANKVGEKFKRLFYEGDTSEQGGDDSAADFALLCLLAYWTQDPDQIERIFSNGELGKRKKWKDTPGYRKRSIKEALKRAKKHYQPSKRQNQKDKEDEVLADAFLIEKGKTHLIADKGSEILSNSECGIFQQQGRLVRIIEYQTAPKKKKEGSVRPNGALTIDQCDEISLINILNRRHSWSKWDARANENKPTDFPFIAAKMILSMNGKNLPFLKGFVCSPTLREDGSLLETPGYDEDSGLFFDPCGTEFPKIPEKPTKLEAEEALATLRDLIKDFPFADDVSRAVALAELMTAVIRRSLDLAPAFANDASTRSSGKTLLAKLSSYICTGKEPTMITPTPNEEEMGKRLGGAFMAGDSIICIDNVDFPFESRDMCVILTAATFNPRILGQSKNPSTGTNSQVVFTGNNLVFKGDICTRVLKCRLFPDTEHPEERKFDRNLEEYTPANRGKLVSAIITIIRAYIASGFPDLDSLSSFRTYSNWTKFIRGPLVWLGQKDPYESAKEIKENDPEKEEIRNVFSAWHEVMKILLIPSESITVSDLIKIVNNPIRREENEQINLLYEVLRSFAPNKWGEIDSKVLGNKIKKFKERIIDGYQLIEKDKDRNKVTIWKISKIL